MSKKIRVADFIANICNKAGSEHVFLVTGGGAMHLNDAFGRHKGYAAFCFHHEQAAAIAAEAYYRTSNKVATLNVTTGPGGINALNGVYGAYVDSIGMYVISGQVKRETYVGNYKLPLRQLGDQEVDIVSMVRPIVKYATVLQDPNQVRVVMEKAIYLATSGRPGPVWIDVPIDIQGALINPDDLVPWNKNKRALADDPDVTPNTRLELMKLEDDVDLKEYISLILQKLKESKRPVIMVGNGVRLSGAHKIFLELVEKLKIPVVTGWNAHDILTNDSRYYAGRPGTVGDRAGNFTVQNSDLLIILGCRLNIRQISYNWKSFANRAWKVMVDVDGAELEKPTLDINLKIQSDLSIFIPAFNDALKNYQNNEIHSTYLMWCRERVDRYNTVLPEYKTQKIKINPYYFIYKLFNKLNSDDIIVAGNGSACVIAFQAASLIEGQRLFTNSGNASMGYDLPAAIGACISRGGKQRIICLAGDGSIMMNLQELQTLIGYALPVKVIVINNNGYHSIRQTQQAYFSDNMFGIGPENGVSIPDFVALAKGFNISSAAVKTIEEWDSQIVNQLLQSEEPALIEVFVDPEQPFSPKLASRKLEDGTMVTPTLDDMAPFLSREELECNRL
jgi:acetolactate synthase-1/2/3 large subunit